MSDPAIKKIIREVVKEELSPLEKRLADTIVEQVTQVVKTYRNDVNKMKDEIVGELQKFREETSVLDLKRQHKRLLDIDKDVDQLKDIHPNFTHQGL